MRDPIEQAMFQTGKSRLEVLETMRSTLAEKAPDTDPRKATALGRLDAAITHERKDAEGFKSDVTKVLSDEYTLDGGAKVRGQSMTYLRQCLRDAGWRGLQPWRLEDKLKASGFKVGRGRNRRGGSCEVVYA